MTAPDRARPLAGLPPLWAIALDKMRDYYGDEFQDEVIAIAREALARIGAGE